MTGLYPYFQHCACRVKIDKVYWVVLVRILMRFRNCFTKSECSFTDSVSLWLISMLRFENSCDVVGQIGLEGRIIGVIASENCSW